MFLICDKSGRIIESLGNKEIVDNTWIRNSKGTLLQLDLVDVYEIDSMPNNKSFYHDGKFSDYSKDEAEQKKMQLLIQLAETDGQLIRVVDELLEFAETLGYKPNALKKKLVQDRKELRKQLSEV